MSETAAFSRLQDRYWLESPKWHLALTLVERQQLMRQYGPLRNERKTDTYLGSATFQRWRSQYPFDSDSFFTERLAALSMSEAEFKVLLSVPAEMLGATLQDRPPWLEQLSAAFSSGCDFECGSHETDFLRAVEPLTRASYKRLHEGVLEIVDGLGNKVFDTSTVEALFRRNLRRRLLWMLGRTFVLELNVARVKGELQGRTPESRFENFIERLTDRAAAIEILQEYPVLARQLMVCADQWLTYCLEFLHRLAGDFGGICAAFKLGSDPGLLIDLKSEAGDRHREGRSVMIARFSSGFTVVYKPRSLAADVHFNELLEWSNEKGFDPGYRKLKVLDRGTYGWVEFVKPETCSSASEIRRFFRRQGGNLALLLVLDGTDIHHENLIAVGEHPVLVDLEALFSPHLNLQDDEEAELLATDGPSNSVLRIGLLPHGKSESTDFSGFGSVAGQLSPVGVPQWQHLATDQMHYVRERTTMSGGGNQPSLAGKPVDASNQADCIDEGFRDMYRLLLKHQQELLSRGGPLAAFAEDEVRVVLRSTQTYSHLREESFHPDVLRDAVDRDYLMDQLWLSVPREPFLSQVMAAEQAALQRCDIPLFTTRVDSRDLWTCSGQRIPQFLRQSGLDTCIQRARHMSEDHLERQRWLIRASLATVGGPIEVQRSSSRESGQMHATAEEYLHWAIVAADRLAALAVRGNSGATWVGMSSTGAQRWSLVPATIELYDGSMGIALFLAHLGSVTGQERFTRLAREAVTASLASCVPRNPIIGRIGGFSGLGGLIYVLTHLGVLWNESELIAKATSFADTLPDLIDRDDHFDVIGGAAGCILTLLGLYRVIENQRILNLATRCGELLVAKATTQPIGYAWHNLRFGSRALTGFSHGAAGVAYALSELSVHADAPRFGGIAQQAMLYERSVFSAKFQNWPDLRESAPSSRGAEGKSEPFSVAWCHGAPGIGLGRLNMLNRFDDPAIRAEIQIAVRTTLASGLCDNQSLCHGSLGNLEFLSQAAERLGGADTVTAVNLLKIRILENIAERGWNCGVPLGVEAPGLMTGLAGIGYGLLRFAEPSRVPSVLTLAPMPIRSGATPSSEWV